VRRPSPQEAVNELTRRALLLTKNGERERARGLLDEAWELTGRRAENAAQLYAQLQVARAYAPLETARSLLIVDSVVDRLNSLADAMADLDGFVGVKLFRGDEIALRAAYGWADAPEGGDSDRLWALLAETDFDRTRSSLDRFRRPELRVMARLRLAQSALRRTDGDVPKLP
jgi:hypothetical protein